MGKRKKKDSFAKERSAECKGASDVGMVGTERDNVSGSTKKDMSSVQRTQDGTIKKVHRKKDNVSGSTKKDIGASVVGMVGTKRDNVSGSTKKDMSSVKRTQDGTIKKVNRRKDRKTKERQEQRTGEQEAVERNVAGTMGLCVQQNTCEDSVLSLDQCPQVGAIRTGHQEITTVDRMQDATSAQERTEAVSSQDHHGMFGLASEDLLQWNSSIVFIRDWQRYCPYASFSSKLRHTFEDEDYETGKEASEFSLPLFGSSNVADLRLSHK